MQPAAVRERSGPQRGTDLRTAEQKEFNGFCRSLAHRIAHGIERVTVVTPHALTAAAILNLGRDRFSLEEILSAVGVYAAHLDAVGAKLADTLVLDYRRAIAHALDSYVQYRILESPEAEAAAAEGGPTEFLVRDARRPVLDYYKNTCVSFFVPAAFAALAILERDVFQFSAADLQTDFEFLQELFGWSSCRTATPSRRTSCAGRCRSSTKAQRSSPTPACRTPST